METDKRFIRNRRPGILVVDDEESIHLCYKEELEEEGYIVHTARIGEEALKIFDLAMHLGKPQIDLVILDINMPGMDGIEVLRQIKQKNPNMPVILSSAYPEYKQDTASWASDDYIVKSFNLDDLKASVRRHLTNYTYHTRLLGKDPYLSINIFNRNNQFRRAVLAVGEAILTGEYGAPFGGIKYDIETRNVGIYFGGFDLDNLAEQTHVVEESRELYLLIQPKHLNPTRRLFVEGEKDARACVSFFDDVPDDVKHKWTVDIAYRLWEKRGRIPGYDQQNWRKAERLIKEATKPFIE